MSVSSNGVDKATPVVQELPGPEKLQGSLSKFLSRQSFNEKGNARKYEVLLSGSSNHDKELFEVLALHKQKIVSQGYQSVCWKNFSVFLPSEKGIQEKGQGCTTSNAMSGEVIMNDEQPSFEGVMYAISFDEVKTMDTCLDVGANFLSKFGAGFNKLPCLILCHTVDEIAMVSMLKFATVLKKKIKQNTNVYVQMWFRDKNVGILRGIQWLTGTMYQRFSHWDHASNASLYCNANFIKSQINSYVHIVKSNNFHFLKPPSDVSASNNQTGSVLSRIGPSNNFEWRMVSLRSLESSGLTFSEQYRGKLSIANNYTRVSSASKHKEFKSSDLYLFVHPSSQSVLSVKADDLVFQLRSFQQFGEYISSVKQEVQCVKRNDTNHKFEIRSSPNTEKQAHCFFFYLRDFVLPINRKSSVVTRPNITSEFFVCTPFVHSKIKELTASSYNIQRLHLRLGNMGLGKMLLSWSFGKAELSNNYFMKHCGERGPILFICKSICSEVFGGYFPASIVRPSASSFQNKFAVTSKIRYGNPFLFAFKGGVDKVLLCNLKKPGSKCYEHLKPYNSTANDSNVPPCLFCYGNYDQRKILGMGKNGLELSLSSHQCFLDIGAESSYFKGNTKDILHKSCKLGSKNMFQLHQLEVYQIVENNCSLSFASQI